MATDYPSEQELDDYFSSPERRREGRNGAAPSGLRGFFWRRLEADTTAEKQDKVQAATVLSALVGLVLFVGFGLLLYLGILMAAGQTPSVEAIENPNLNLATVAYTADGKELARYGRQNRSWVTYDEISPNVIGALVATEDHRFYDHWGIDLFRTFSAIAQTLLGDVQGGSTITQQLARNLYNDQIGFDRSPTRKLKEMVTAIQLERQYTKKEIIEMYLNTVPFRHNAYGIEAAARTYFSKPASELNVKEAGILIGMLKANTRYDPIRNPENAKLRRNVVMRQMTKHDYLDPAAYDTLRTQPIETDFRGSDVTDSFAPYFAEHVRLWLNDWSERSGVDVYAEGLVVYTTLDSTMQDLAQTAVGEQMEGLQAVVDYEWSRASNWHLGGELSLYTRQTDYEPWAHFWAAKRDLARQFIRETDHYRQLRQDGVGQDAAVDRLLDDPAFMDSLKAEKTRLEAGFVALDPRNGHVKAWVGGRNLKVDRYDHVAIAKRQPGSTFKPFVYTAAIDNGYPATYRLRDSLFTYRDAAGNVWQPQNSGGDISGRWMTLAEGLARSKNTITGQLILEIEPSTAAFYARRMGIQSDLEEVPSLALGTSDVTLLEMTSAYATLANGGLYYAPTVVTRIEDRAGNVLYEATPTPREALSEETAYTVVSMMRNVIEQSYGTGQRIQWQFGLDAYDFAGKTGTTQNSADNWFMLMHPELVTGAWVGFNDQRVTFRSNWWGQGAHTALFLVGDFLRRVDQSDAVKLDASKTFPSPSAFGVPEYNPTDAFERDAAEQSDDGRVGW
ncbi:MAG: PBP1A family penicillin-binding protein [Bacteroidetes bacterium]|jgi:penicillin-binding protein 1A|nr:PBP1A family penicillin-binding protein [Bacteroidota bacterium]